MVQTSLMGQGTGKASCCLEPHYQSLFSKGVKRFFFLAAASFFLASLKMKEIYDSCQKRPFFFLSILNPCRFFLSFFSVSYLGARTDNPRKNASDYRLLFFLLTVLFDFLVIHYKAVYSAQRHLKKRERKDQNPAQTPFLSPIIIRATRVLRIYKNPP